MNVLVIDIGGTNVKVWDQESRRPRKISSGPQMTPNHLRDAVRQLAELSSYEAVSIGYPGKLAAGKIVREPWNLGSGWVDHDFGAWIPQPWRIMNDAAMQALGAYEGGAMLFLGLGTSVGSTLIVDNVVMPLELGNVPHSFGQTLEHLLARDGLDRLGKNKWRHAVLDALPRMRDAFMADYVVLGGGNAKKLKRRLPLGMRLGSNRNAFRGGRRLWECRDLTTVHVFEGEACVSAGQAAPLPPDAGP
jgi:polyphosphate glucokinase